MARIVFGVMGDARGHVTEALTIAHEMPQHEFLFVGGGKVHELKTEGYAVEDVPMGSTLYRNNSVDIPATATNAVKVFLTGGKVRRRIARVIAEFDPHLIITDYEYFTPLAARSLGRPCVSLDHQHIMTHCVYEPPAKQGLSRIMTGLSVSLLYSNSSKFIIISFFKLPPANSETTVVMPPLIRNGVKILKPDIQDHVLVYQTSSTFHRLLSVLEQVKNRFFIYGLGDKPPRNNLVFKPASKEEFLEDLASCRYVITNGGHNVICEALYLGKPVLSFPISNAYEQFLNAYFLEKRGYGAHSTTSLPDIKLFYSFESRLDWFRTNINRDNFLGNQSVINELERLVAGG